MNAATFTADQEVRLTRALNSLRGLAALADSENAQDEALIGRRGDLADLLCILGEELEHAITGNRPFLW